MKQGKHASHGNILSGSTGCFPNLFHLFHLLHPLPLPPNELRLLRTTRGLTQKQVAEAFGVSLTSIVNYEKGQTSIPSGLPECIKKMAEPKVALTSEIDASRRPAYQLLEEYGRKRAEERAQWLSLIQEINPEQLREFRLSRGLSKIELASIVEVSPTSLFLYESGQQPIPKDLMQKIINLAPDAAITPSELRELRLSLGLSQADLADFLGLSKAMITRYEAGKQIITHILSEKILEYFQDEAKLGLTCDEMKLLRISMNLSQRAFGEMLGITKAAETQYENGRRKIPKEVRRKILAIMTNEAE